MRTIKVQTGRPYDILIERGLIDKCGELIRTVSNAQKVCVVTDSNVEKFYAEKVIKSIQSQGFETELFVFPAGEESKRLSTIADMYNAFANFHMSRKDLVVALGGGVTGDMAGFAAASYMRGIEFVQIPTSLLAQVDSSVGGKTGVDIEQGKNLVGAFWQPNMVIIDPDTLSTLPQYYINDGMAEVIKYGCIKDKKLFETLEKENAIDIIEDIIEICVSIKRDVVNADERESGQRMLLNFGHTLGHSLEKIYNYKGLSHGQAVAIGMCIITKASEKAGITEVGTTDKIVALCKKYGLPVSDKASYADISAVCASDKKASGGSVSLVLLDKIGSSFTKATKLSDIEKFITV
jgi:3-dehydroquinate synthase